MVDGLSGFSQVTVSANLPKDVLTLFPGQVVHGIVLEVTPENAVILLNGINVVAELETALVPGEELMLQVVEQRDDGKVLLQRSTLQQGLQREPSLVGKDMEGLLKYFGMKTTKLNEAILRELFQLKVPITQRAVDLLSSLAVKNNVSPEKVPALTWLWARGLPISRESVTVTAGLMGRGFQDTKMAELLQVLSQGLSGGQEAKSGSQVETPVYESTLGKALEQVLLKPEETRGQWSQKLQDAPGNLGFGHEKDILKLLEQSGGGSPGAKGTSLPVEQGRTLKAALIEMLSTGSQPSGDKMPAGKEAANGLLKDITGFQLLNITGRQEGDGVSTFIPGWVVMEENEIRPFFLKVKEYYGGSGGSGEDFRCQVLFFISTKEMGEVMCRLALENNCLTCGFTVHGAEESRLLDSFLPVLHDRLKDLPWETVLYPTKILSSQEIDKTWYEETFVIRENNYRGLDARI